MADPKATSTTMLVLQALLARPTDERFGYELMKVTSLGSGTIYPILERLEEAGWVDSSWERIDPTVEGRPARRLYRLTGEGAPAAQRIISNYRARMRRARSSIGATP